MKEASSPVFFLSGDRHLAELMEIAKHELGYVTYEITTSAIHAKVYADAWKDSPNPRQIEGRSGSFNYLVATTRVEPKWEIEAQVYGPERARLFSRTLHVEK